MIRVPTLATDRLLLRPMTRDDWPAYRDLMASERAEHMGGPFSTRASWGMFCSDHAQWAFFECGALMIEDRSTCACLGQIGINSGPPYPEWELGWFVYPEAEGRGYAFEAARELRDWARDMRKLSTLVSYVDPANDRSRRLAERLGAVLDPDAPRQDPSDLVYRHFRASPATT
jgi:RimJ/RimL family protein N-acetyltransferase